MGTNSNISWCDHTFNPWWGCVKVSEGCKNCYAETLSSRYGGNYWGPTAERRLFEEKHWEEPLKWNEKAEREGVRYKVFCGSMCDVFEEHGNGWTDSLLVRARSKLWELIKITPHLDWLLLTKRPENIIENVWLDWYSPKGKGWPTNVWIGTSVENQKRADERIPELLKIPAKVRFLSVEPMLERISLDGLVKQSRYTGRDNGNGLISMGYETDDIQWIICGAESGGNRRPFDPHWAEVLWKQARAVNIPFFMKQGGAFKPGQQSDIPDWLWNIKELPTQRS